MIHLFHLLAQAAGAPGGNFINDWTWIPLGGTVALVVALVVATSRIVKIFGRMESRLEAGDKRFLVMEARIEEAWTKKDMRIHDLEMQLDNRDLVIRGTRSREHVRRDPPPPEVQENQP